MNKGRIGTKTIFLLFSIFIIAGCNTNKEVKNTTEQTTATRSKTKIPEKDISGRLYNTNVLKAAKKDYRKDPKE